MSTPLRTLLLLTLVLSACKTGSQTSANESQNDSQQIAGWHEYGGQNAAKFSPLKQINRGNIDELEVAWTHNS
ncbi:MAG: hypothetical protein ABJK20_16505, partial [Halieaceae bacterium]